MDFFYLFKSTHQEQHLFNTTSIEFRNQIRTLKVKIYTKFPNYTRSYIKYDVYVLRSLFSTLFLDANCNLVCYLYRNTFPISKLYFWNKIPELYIWNKKYD